MTPGPDEPRPETYSHGHHDSVLRSHRWRTADNSCAYLLPHLRPGQRLLDLGCGPGTITADLAERVAPGRVVGVDRSEDVLAEAARVAADRGLDNVTFETGDAYDLRFGDGELDVVHAHQVLQHLTDPVAALVEMGRVLRPGGILAVRDSDYGAFVWWPADPLLTRWCDLYHQITAANRAEADAGRRLPTWVRAAGWSDAVTTTSTWTFADQESRSWWGDLWAERVTASAFAEQAIGYGLSQPGELDAIAAAWRRWATDPDGYFAVIHTEVLARQV
jgi:ubiquinone/menaquinone biosynthesis C-methylase UbiE